MPTSTLLHAVFFAASLSLLPSLDLARRPGGFFLRGSMSDIWCSRSLVIAPVYFGLCITEDAFQKQLKKLGVKRETWPKFSYSHATTHFFEKPDGKRCVIVCISDWKERSGIQIAALLVHEAVHIWQEIRDVLGEKQPSSEFEAYSIQSISQELMDSFHKQAFHKK